MYNSSNGQIKIDDITIEDVNLHSLRGSIGYVPQDPFLFSDALNNNINLEKMMPARKGDWSSKTCGCP